MVKITGVILMVQLFTPGIASAAPEDCQGMTDYNLTRQCLHKQNQLLQHGMRESDEELLRRLKQAEEALPTRFRGKLLVQFKLTRTAWEKYRDAQCEFERMHAAGGVEEPIILLQCKNAQISARIKSLQEQIQQWAY